MEHSELTEAALVDELTGLYNRRHLNGRLPEDLKEAESSRSPLSLFMLDVDYFKDINDTHGHRAGDETLTKVAHLLSENVRDTDTVFRYAGDEFAVVLPNTDNDTALEVARKVADRVSGRALDVLGKPINVTISLGVATYPEDGEDPATLFGFADRALYARKRRGRNGVCGRREVVEDVELLRPTFCPEIVGRREELSRLKELLARSFEGKGGLVLLSGEAGVGKTRLLNEFAESARRRGALVLLGRSFGEPTSFPYQPFKDALRKYSRAGDGERRKVLQSLPEVYRNELLSLVPELMELGAERGPAAEIEPDEARLRLFDAVRHFLVGISKERPLALIFDDLHSADESSSQLLHYLARNLRESPVLICGAFRGEELEVVRDGKKPLAKAMHSMSRDDLFSHITLGRLSLEETSRMIGLILNADEVREPFSLHIYGETEGNPFFVEEVLKSLIEGGKVTTKSDLAKVDLDGLEIPTAMRDVIQRRLDMLDPDTNKILSFASVIGHSFPFDVLLLVSELNEGHLLDVIEQALRSQLIMEEGEEEYRFSHGKIGETIYEGIAKRKRRRLHRVVGESLEKVRGEKVEEFASDLSHHFHQAQEWGKSFKYSYEAGKRAKGVYANDDAILSYRTALDALGRLSSEEQETLCDSTMSTFEDMGDVLCLLGRYEDAMTSYEEMRTKAESAGRKGAEATALTGIAWVYSIRGSYDEALRYYEESLAISKEIDDKGCTARSLNGIGSVHRRRGSHDEALMYYEESLAIRREIGDKRDIASSLSNTGLAHLSKGCYDEALTYYGESLAINEETGNRRGIAINLVGIGMVHMVKGSYDEALRHFERCLAISTQIGSKRGMAYGLMGIGAVHLGKGHYDEALRLGTESLAMFREMGDKGGIRDVVGGLHRIGSAYWRKGSYDEALRCYEDALGIHREIGDRSGVAESLLSKGGLKRQLGLLEDAVDVHGQALSLAREIGDRKTESQALTELGLDMLRSGNLDDSLSRLKEALAIEIEDTEVEAEVLRGLAETHIALGECEKADEAIKKLLSIAERTKSREHLIEAHLLKARSLSPSQKALPHGEKALRLSEELGSPECLWRAHQLLGRILKEKGDLSTAGSHYQQAKAIVESIASKISDPKTRETYLSKPEHKELFDECRSS